jgi:hypothetical protein
MAMALLGLLGRKVPPDRQAQMEQQGHRASRAFKACPVMLAHLETMANKACKASRGYRVFRASLEMTVMLARREILGNKGYKASKGFRVSRASPALAALRSMRGR